MAKRDNLQSAGMHPRRVDGCLIGLGARAGEEGFLQAAGRDLRNLLGERDHRLVRIER